MSTNSIAKAPSEVAQRAADAALTAARGSVVTLLVSPAIGDTTDAGQLGINAPQFQQLPLSPAVFRRTRATMTAGQQAKYEIVISASAVEQQASALQMGSAGALFAATDSVIFAGEQFQIETWSYSAASGRACLYRLQVRAAQSQSVITTT